MQCRRAIIDRRRTLLGAAAFAGVIVQRRAPVRAAAEPPTPELALVPEGSFVAGSDDAEREAAYRLDARAYGEDITRRQRWYDDEFPRHRERLPSFHIARTPTTNRQYASFVQAAGHPRPGVDAKTWQSYGLKYSFDRARRYAWTRAGSPANRLDHPVVLVAHGDAVAYGEWLAKTTGRSWRLPGELEWEKAARGPDGRASLGGMRSIQPG